MKDTVGALRPSLFDEDNSDFINVGGLRHSIRPRRSAARILNGQEFDDSEANDVPSHSILVEHKTSMPVSDDAWLRLSEEDAGIQFQYQGNTPLVEFHRDSQTARAFDLLRTRLRKAMQDNGWTNIAVVSPTSGCGNTFTALNLALSLSRVPQSRTILMDMNLRSPGVAKALEMDGRGPIRDYLSGLIPTNRHMVRISQTLALGLNRDVCENAPETLQDPATAETLVNMRTLLKPDTVIYDLPPMLVHDDLSAFLPQIDGVLIVSDGAHTTARHLKECEQMLDGQVPLLGVVLNRARASSIKSYH